MENYIVKPGMTKSDILAHVGSLSQLAGVTRKRVAEGPGDGMVQYEVRNGSGLSFTLLEGKALDVFEFSYFGIPFHYITKGGLKSSERFVPHNSYESLRNNNGGMLYTCGLANSGYDYQDPEYGCQPYHGRMRATPATNTQAKAVWDEDTYKIEIYGEMREANQFGENLVLRRTVSCEMGRPVLKLEDEVENEGFEESPLMLLYHTNVGYPVLDEDAKVWIPKCEISIRDEWDAKNIEDRLKMEPPTVGKLEQVFHGAIRSEGLVKTIIWQPKLGLGFYIQQDTSQLPYLTEWKTMRAGDYVLGLHPSNCHCEGRIAEEKKYHSLCMIRPFEKKKFSLELGVIDGVDHLNQLINNI